jgi:hypothetical protein
MSRFTRIGMLVLACGLVPAAASAQQAPADLQALRAELQEVETQLVPLQQQALEDEALASQQAEVTAAVRSAMIAENPELEARLDRMGEIMTEARAAQAAGDAERIVALTTEAQEIQPVIAAAQERALAQPEIAAQVDAFQTALHARMAEIDAGASTLLQRRQDLVNRIREAEGGA